jgi:hypothetical protein
MMFVRVVRSASRCRLKMKVKTERRLLKESRRFVVSGRFSQRRARGRGYPLVGE